MFSNKHINLKCFIYLQRLEVIESVVFNTIYGVTMKHQQLQMFQTSKVIFS